MTAPCRVCGASPDTNIAPGRLRDLRLMFGPRWRATIGRLRDWMCVECQLWVARYFGIAL